MALQREALARAAARTALDALDAADAEDELLDALEALGVAEPWRLAEPLAAAGVDAAWLERVAALAGPATDAARALGRRVADRAHLAVRAAGARPSA